MRTNIYRANDTSYERTGQIEGFKLECFKS